MLKNYLSKNKKLNKGNKLFNQYKQNYLLYKKETQNNN